MDTFNIRNLQHRGSIFPSVQRDTCTTACIATPCMPVSLLAHHRCLLKSTIGALASGGQHQLSHRPHGIQKRNNRHVPAAACACNFPRPFYRIPPTILGQADKYLMLVNTRRPASSLKAGNSHCHSTWPCSR